MNWYKTAQSYIPTTPYTYPYYLEEIIKMQGEKGLAINNMDDTELKHAKELEQNRAIKKVIKQDEKGKYWAYILEEKSVFAKTAGKRWEGIDEHYQSIAHPQPHEHEKDYYVWAYINGKIQSEVSLPGEIPLDHSIWELNDNDYYGRCDPYKNVVSIHNPFEGRPIPEPILRGLYDEFGNDIRIVEFN